MTHPEQHPFPSRILVVDDEKSTRTVIGRALQLLGYLVDDAENGEQALERLANTRYDVMLLDLNMPIMNGSQVMDVVRDLYPELQVIILTAHATLDSAIAAVKTGAVDYLLKPQSIAQIDKAIQQSLKRRFSQSQRRHLIEIIGEAMHTLQIDDDPSRQDTAEAKTRGSPIEMNGMFFDPEQRKLITYEEISVAEQPAVRTSELTAHQSAILTYMVLHPFKVISCLEISREALGYQNLTKIEADHIVRPHILKLRRKIETDPSNPRLIRSVRGKGYLFSPP
ncbi:MAG: response regulator transcription factor [Chloroflexi bacterium]|nr:response regulator transcription factor [Chloroflexota bacterium]